jgi:hypothetical protein
MSVFQGGRNIHKLRDIIGYVGKGTVSESEPNIRLNEPFTLSVHLDGSWRVAKEGKNWKYNELALAYQGTSKQLQLLQHKIQVSGNPPERTPKPSLAPLSKSPTSPSTITKSKMYS